MTVLWCTAQLLLWRLCISRSRAIRSKDKRTSKYLLISKCFLQIPEFPIHFLSLQHSSQSII